MSLNNIIKPSTSADRRLLALETMLNLTDKISKVSDDSVVSAIAGGVARIAGKAEKDIFLALSVLFPNLSFGSHLDQTAEIFGVPGRITNLGSSTYIRIVATPGTVYQANVHYFLSNNNIRFQLLNDITISSFGFSYAKIESITQGNNTNVDSLSISQVSPTPNGHQYVINEVPATGGFDLENDQTFRSRIQDGANILAKSTLSMIEQLFILLNPKILNVYHHGMNEFGQVVLAISTQNGSDLSQLELDNLLDFSSSFFSLTEYKPIGKNFYGIQLKNIEYQPFDISFRCQLDGSRTVDQIRKDIQIKIQKSVDYRFFDPTKQLIEWDNLLEIVKSTLGIKYAPDQFFYPRIDLKISNEKLPRMRGFLMLNIDGTVLSNQSGTLNPIYYPNQADFIYSQTILSQLT
jgi:hypothetical protein